MDRIAPGHHLYPGPDGNWRHSAPDGRFTRIRGPHALLSSARRDAYGAASPAAADHPGRESAHALRTALRERGVLIADDDERSTGTTAESGTAPWNVHIEGDNPVAHAVAALLPPGARVATGRLDEDAVRAADTVVSCAGWLPDAHWQHVDEWCARHSTSWHRCHAEGLRFVLGPMCVPGRTVGYADTRGRLLAAADLPDELAAHWSYLDGDALPPVPWPGPGVTAVLAGLLVGDLLHRRDKGVPAARDTQLVVDPATLATDRHRVLPLPVTAHAEAAR
ncbi:hypothetical protein AB0E88_29435 [Streptomyces sp. NPDC028635]|uniref:hypothetical protein n=1 Tax=Streptomyces sp. NPDC028635 TaxID=3154800 RepID=UPI0033EA7C01